MAAFVLVGVAAAAATSAGCQTASETSELSSWVSPSGTLLLHASASGDDHHTTVEVALSAAPSGTYALVYAKSAAAAELGAAAVKDDPALACALAFGRDCALSSAGGAASSGTRVLAASTIGPGGAGVLRAAYDVGAGGFFDVVRVDGAIASGELPAKVSFRIAGEAVTRDQTPSRFALEVVSPSPAAPAVVIPAS